MMQEKTDEKPNKSQLKKSVPKEGMTLVLCFVVEYFQCGKLTDNIFCA